MKNNVPTKNIKGKRFIRFLGALYPQFPKRTINETILHNRAFTELPKYQISFFFKNLPYKRPITANSSRSRSSTRQTQPRHNFQRNRPPPPMGILFNKNTANKHENNNKQNIPETEQTEFLALRQCGFKRSKLTCVASSTSRSRSGSLVTLRTTQGVIRPNMVSLVMVPRIR